MRKVYGSANEAMLWSIAEVLDEGISTHPRNKQTVEITSMSFVIKDPRNRVCTSRVGLRSAYPAALLAWNLNERRDVAGIEGWNPNAKHFTDDGVHVQGEDYGNRFMPSLDGALHVLNSDSHSRRCWVSVWKPDREYGELVHDHTWNSPELDEMPAMKSSNVPCCIGFGLRIVSGQLVMQTVMRSQSLWGVFPYDVFLMTTLQELIANELKVPLGWYEHTMLSAHVYDHELKWISHAINRKDVDPIPMQPIRRGLSSAADAWGRTLDMCNGDAPWDEALVQSEMDPIVKLLTDEKRGERERDASAATEA